MTGLDRWYSPSGVYLSRQRLHLGPKQRGCSSGPSGGEVQKHSFLAVGTWRPRTAPDVLFRYTAKAAPGPGLRASPSAVLLAHKPLIGKTLLDPPSSRTVLASGTGGALFLPLRYPASCLFRIGPLP